MRPLTSMPFAGSLIFALIPLIYATPQAKTTTLDQRQVVSQVISLPASLPGLSSGMAMSSVITSVISSSNPILTPVSSATQPIIPASTSATLPSNPAMVSTSTTSLSLALSLLTTISSTSPCLTPGGGCQVFNIALTPCTDDTCACSNDLTLSAQVCAQCIGTGNQISAYNTFLSACEGAGLSQPTETLEVGSVVSASSAPGAGIALASGQIAGVQLTSVLPTSSIASSPSDGVISSAPVAMVQIATNSLSSSGTSTIGSTGLLTNVMTLTTSSAITSTFSIPSASMASSIPSILNPSTAAMIGTATQVNSTGTGIGALSASVQFFTYSIGSCNVDCQVWEGLSTSCKDDTCICTSSALTSASTCQSCIGSSTHSADYPTQMSSYTSFVGNCTSAFPGLSPSGTTSSAGSVSALPDQVAGVQLGSTAGAGITAAPSGSAIAAEANGVVTVTKSGDAERGISSEGRVLLLGLAVVGLLVLL